MEDNKIKVYLSTLRQKGYLAYEYNPFHNYQTNEDLYIIDSIKKYLGPDLFKETFESIITLLESSTFFIISSI